MIGKWWARAKEVGEVAKEMGSESIREAMLNSGTETQDMGDGKNNYNSRIYTLSPLYWPRHVFLFLIRHVYFLFFPYLQMWMISTYV